MKKKKLDNRYVYKISKEGEEHIGTNDEISKILGIQVNSLSSLYFRGYKVKGYKLERIGVYKRIYELYDENGLVGEFTVEELSSQLYITKEAINSAVFKGNLMLNRYTVKNNKYKILYF